MSTILKTAPAVFAVRDTYQIMVPVTCDALMWVKVGNQCYCDECNGILRSAVTTHKMIVPAEELDRAGKYTVCWRKMLEKKPYYPETEEVVEQTYDFYPVRGEKITAYHISDAHNKIDLPIACAKKFEKEYGKIDFLILNGDISNFIESIETYDNIYMIASEITGGHIPIVFSRGNHDLRGPFSEKMLDHTPTDEGRTYYTFRMGSIWGLVLDCGEDKPDWEESYGNTILFHPFREKETKFIENVIANARQEYEAEGVEHKIVVVHCPFTRLYENELFNSEKEIYRNWAKLLKDSVKPDMMLCGHVHQFAMDFPGGEHDQLGQPCPVVVGVFSKPKLFAGAGLIFRQDKIDVVFNDSEQITETHEIIKRRGEF